MVYATEICLKCIKIWFMTLKYVRKCTNHMAYICFYRKDETQQKRSSISSRLGYPASVSLTGSTCAASFLPRGW